MSREKRGDQNLLSLVGRNGRGVDTVTDASDATSDDELRSGTSVGRNSADLDDDTNDHDTGTEEDGLAATEAVTEGKDEAGTEEATNSVDGDDETLVGAVAVNLGESLDECGGGDDAGHDALVVTEEEEVGGGNDGDEDLKHSAGLPPVGGHARLGFDYVRRHCDGVINDQQKLERDAGDSTVGSGCTFK
jgi:hypothetical protein